MRTKLAHSISFFLSGSIFEQLIFPKMSFSKLALAALACTAAATPAQKRQLSLPNALIPKIPGVTDIISENAPPLPILQLPTPPLDSPPWQGSNIKPKKIGSSINASHFQPWTFN
jgi:hypothetical protein